LAAGTTFVGSKLLVLHIVSPESNDERQGAGNERERPISSHIASRDGDDFNAIYHIVSHGGDSITTISIVSISYLLRHAMATATTMAVATTFVIRQPLVYPLRVA
jgi:hypothetical protein